VSLPLHPAACVLGQTYYSAPNFLSADFNVVVNGNFTDPNQLTFVGNTITDHVVMTGLNPAGLKAEMAFTISDSGSSSILGSLWIGGGMGLARGASGVNPSAAVPDGVWFVPHYTTPRYVMNHYITTLYESGNLASLTTYGVIITLTVSEAPVAGYYTLTHRLQIPAAGIDHSEIDPLFLLSSWPTVNLFINGPVSPGPGSAMTVEQLYITGLDLPGSCQGIGFPQAGVELLYPIVPEPIADRLVHATDARAWKVTAREGNEKYCTLKFRVDQSVFGYFMEYLRAYYASTFDISTPGAHPFGDAYTVNTVYCVGYQPPFKEFDRKWRIDVRFKQVAGVS